MEPNYSKREIDMLMDSIKDHISDTVVIPLSRIEAQTIKTNGRVTALEGWRNYIAGGMALFVLIVLPMLWTIWNDTKVDSDKLNQHMLTTK